MSDIDSLVNELFPTVEKKDPVTTSPSTLTPIPNTTNAKKTSAVDDFDKSSDEEPVTKPKRSSVPWPKIPENTIASCPPQTCKLFSSLSLAEQRFQQLHLFSNKPVTASLAQSDASQDPCLFIRCVKCDHAVVRLDAAYWTKRRAPLSSVEEETQPITAPSVSKPKLAHNFDDSSDEDDAPQPKAATVKGSLRTDEEMYMLTRYHFPDFAAFPKPALVRTHRKWVSAELGATTVASSSSSSSGADSDVLLSAAAYCCQCSHVSVIDDQVSIAVRPGCESECTRQPKLELAVSDPEALIAAFASQQDGELVAKLLKSAPPSSSKPGEVRWVCKGHKR